MFRLRREEPLAEADRTGLAERPRRMAPGQKLILVGTAAGAAVVVLIALASRHNYFGWLGTTAGAPPAAAPDARRLGAPSLRVPLALETPPRPGPEAVECSGGLRLPPGMPCPAPEAQTPPAGGPSAAPVPQATEADRIRERRRRGAIALSSAGASGGLTAHAGSSGAAGAPMPPVPPAASPASAAGPGAAAGAGPLGNALTATATPAARAWRNANPSMTLAKGSLPDCTLLTAVLTDQPGFLKCLLSAPVMSMDGRVVLMEAGTVFEGEYTQGMRPGQSTIFTLWSRAVTPQFVVVPLDSPGTDPLGRAGVSGQIDDKWFERFAGAAFFSFFEDVKELHAARAGARAANRAGGDTYNIGAAGGLSDFGRSDRATTAIVEEMLGRGRQIVPSLYKNQGEVIKIFVARDIDFSQVYALRAIDSSDRRR